MFFCGHSSVMGELLSSFPLPMRCVLHSMVKWSHHPAEKHKKGRYRPSNDLHSRVEWSHHPWKERRHRKGRYLIVPTLCGYLILLSLFSLSIQHLNKVHVHQPTDAVVICHAISSIAVLPVIQINIESVSRPDLGDLICIVIVWRIPDCKIS